MQTVDLKDLDIEDIHLLMQALAEESNSWLGVANMDKFDALYEKLEKLAEHLEHTNENRDFNRQSNRSNL